jgi:acyl-coenzyme A synthetase/AMP-(fatty) acid ligase
MVDRSRYWTDSAQEALVKCFERLECGESMGLGEGVQEWQEAPTGASGPCLGIWSSGSTGRPKRVWRRWGELKAELRTHAEIQGWHWVTPFRPDSFAGVQVALQAWASGGSVSFLDRNWDQTWEILRDRLWQALSATPTFLDLLLQQEPAASRIAAPRQITLGGEVLRPACGTRIRSRFPESRIRVVYASAEFGVVATTQRLDGWYELRGLEQRFLGWRLRSDPLMESGFSEIGTLELQRSSGDWVTTGDCVECRDGLLRVLGRVDRIANVGGTKVSLDEVTSWAERVPGVRRAWAQAVRSSLTGEVVGLRYCPDEGWDPVQLERELQDFLRLHLPKAAWPRTWVVDPVLPVMNAKRGEGALDREDVGR